MVPMHQHGGWWSGRTDTQMKVSVSDRFFRHMLERQEARRCERPDYYSRDMQKYGVSPVCRSPQWWVEVFLDHDYAIGMQEHTWTRRRHYAKLVLQPTDDRYALIPVPSPGGTLIFRERGE